MIEPAIFVARLLQYSGATVLGGSSLFFLYAAPAVWPRKLLGAAAVAVLMSSLAAIGLWAGQFGGGRLSDGFAFEPMAQIVALLAVGKAALLRAPAALLALVFLVLPNRRAPRIAVAIAGALTVVSLAWMGHAAAAEAWWQIAGDVVHVVSAAIWLGALVGLLVVAGGSDPVRMRIALERFSALGVPLVAMLVLSGLANSWYLVGPDKLASLGTTDYGQLLLAKLAIFGAMLGLAALNRYRLTPALNCGEAPAPLAQVRRSVAIEAALGLAVLAVVAWLGALEPPAAL